MKRIAIILSGILALASTSVASAQTESRYFKQGYMGNVELGVGADVANSKEEFASVLTSHGYVVGKGVYIGAGLGAMTSFRSKDARSTIVDFPLFFDVKYSPLDKKVSPFVGASVGIHYNLFHSVGAYVSPSLGANFGRWSVFFRYTYREYSSIKTVDIAGGDKYETVDQHFNNHLITFNVAFSF